MSDQRKNIMLGTAGHVDHGKTALVKNLTGCDLDRLAVEKERGLTIELGFAPCRMKDERIVGVVDVPGHVGFIRNMVAGAHGVDVVILVVAADDAVMPQTREHLDILTLMGVTRGIVAMTKIDLVDAELRDLVEEDIREFVQGTFLAEAPICGVSNVTGEGFDGLLGALNAAVAACEPRATAGADSHFRMWIERTFSMRGFGTVVSGIPVSGEARDGDRLQLVPGQTTGRVRGLEVYGEDASIGRAGECVALNVVDFEPRALQRGATLCAVDGSYEPVSMAEAELRVLPGAGRGVKDYAEVHVHVGTAEAMGHVALLAGRPIAPGGSGLVQLRLAEPLGVAPGDRFVIRANVPGQGGGMVTTIGGGRILDTSNIRLRRNRPWTLEALQRRSETIEDPARWCECVLAESAEAISPAELAGRAKLPAGRVANLLAEAKAAGRVLDAFGGKLLGRRRADELAEQIEAALAAFHDSNPKRLGLPVAELAGRVAADAAALSASLAAAVAGGRVDRHDELLSLPGRVVRLSAEDQALCDRLEDALRAAGLTPPLPADLADSVGAAPEQFDSLVRMLADQGKVIVLDAKVILHADSLAAARQTVLDLFRHASGFTTMEFRDALGVSRKYAVPLLDYFDTVKLTVRSGNRRTPGARAKAALAGE